MSWKKITSELDHKSKLFYSFLCSIMLIQKHLISLVKIYFLKKVQNAEVDLIVKAFIRTSLSMGCENPHGYLLSFQIVCLGVPHIFMQHKTQANLEVSISLEREVVLDQR